MLRFQSYGDTINPEVIARRVMTALQARVLHSSNQELHAYFDKVVQATTSPLGGAPPEEDGISNTSNKDIEQCALLLCHHDADGDGLLAPAEFAAVIELIASQTGATYSPQHIEKIFSESDIDRSGFIDLNELCLLRTRRKR
mmetsp:Transcript_36133/g.95222  ORF Transcript_36133/g.95222 Transcript_36133/m.95222 type:complete len:142 (-) Transcript_36133:90-515(-)